MQSFLLTMFSSATPWICLDINNFVVYVAHGAEHGVKATLLLGRTSCRTWCSAVDSPGKNASVYQYPHSLCLLFLFPRMSTVAYHAKTNWRPNWQHSHCYRKCYLLQPKLGSLVGGPVTSQKMDMQDVERLNDIVQHDLLARSTLITLADSAWSKVLPIHSLADFSLRSPSMVHMLIG